MNPGEEMKHYQNNQQWSECNLVSIWNAARFFGMSDNIPVMGTPEYQASCVIAGSIYGAAINVDAELRQQKLSTSQGLFCLSWLSSNLPVTFAVFCRRGHHSVLAVAVKDGQIMLANYAKGRTQWVSWSKLLEMSNVQVLPVKFTVCEGPQLG